MLNKKHHRCEIILGSFTSSDIKHDVSLYCILESEYMHDLIYYIYDFYYIHCEHNT